jgi:hypothetical protein
MGGASRREILSIKPEIFFLRAVSDTSLKAFLTHSTASGVKGYTMVEGCQGAHISNRANTEENAAEHTVDITDALTAQLAIFLSTDSI